MNIMKEQVNITMKKLHFCMLLLLPILISCSTSEQALIENPFITETIHIGPTREVTSLEAFFSDSERPKVENVHLIIDAGDYTSNKAIWVSGENITIEGLKKVNLFCSDQNDNVMWITGKNIIVSNIRMKHTNPLDSPYNNCSGRVIAFDNARNIIVENCDLNGCGLAGLHDNMGNASILIKNNYIHNNSLGAYTDISGGIWFKEVSDHPVFRFENNRMENNGPDRVVESDTED